MRKIFKNRSRIRMKKTGLAVMLAAALLAGSLSVYADEIDTENPGMEETAEAQEAEPEEEPVPDTYSGARFERRLCMPVYVQSDGH